MSKYKIRRYYYFKNFPGLFNYKSCIKDLNIIKVQPTFVSLKILKTSLNFYIIIIFVFNFVLSRNIKLPR